jgi:DNA anti-recombination protein RmuC
MTDDTPAQCLKAIEQITRTIRLEAEVTHMKQEMGSLKSDVAHMNKTMGTISNQIATMGWKLALIAAIAAGGGASMFPKLLTMLMP